MVVLRLKKTPITLRRDPETKKCNHTNPYCLSYLSEVSARIAPCTDRHGLGFGFLREFNLCYIDLDNSRDPESGQLTDFAADVVRRLNSYTEISISERGLHIVVRGLVEKSRMRTRVNWPGKQIEIKCDRHYMTVSGNRLPGTPRTIEDRQTELNARYEEIFGEQAQPTPRPEKGGKPPEVKNRRGGFVRSRLCDLLISLSRFGMTPEEIEEFLTDHPVVDREKWRERPDYRKGTILAAHDKSLQRDDSTIHHII